MRGFLPETFGQRVARYLAELAVHVNHPAFQIGDNDRDRALLHGERQLPHLLLRALALGNVHGKALESLRFALRRGEGPPAGNKPTLTPIAQPDPILHVDRFPVLHRAIQTLLHRCPILRVDGFLEPRQGDFLILRVTEQRPRSLSGPELKRVAIHHPEPGLGRVYRETQPLLALAQGTVSAFPGERIGENLGDELQAVDE